MTATTPPVDQTAPAEKARREGIKVLYLVAGNAQSFFGEKLGWEVIDRRDCDPAITTTREFKMARSENAVWMRKVL